MYHQYFGLSEAPFSIAVNPRYLFMSPRHRDALAHLLYGIGTGGGFILLTGEVGTGKTTINRCLLEQLPDDTDIAIILNPALNAIELLATVCDELKIQYDADKYTLKTLTDKLHQFLLQNHERGRKTVLLIDEAQHLNFDVLEQIRLLTNLETNSEKLLQIILIGQPELAQILSRPELRQLNQRITARYNLEPLSQEETAAYIQHRLQVAGLPRGQDVFPAAVVKGIHRYTRGIPRLINVLCDRMLLGAYSRNQSRTDKDMLRIAAKEVMGESAAELQARSWSFWPAALLSAVLVIGVGVATWWYDATQSDAPTVALIEVSPESSPRPALREAAGTAAVEEPPQVKPMEPPEIAPAVSEAEAALSNWLLSPTDAERLMWGLYSNEPMPSPFCAEDVLDGVACTEGTAETWSELSALDRPLLLDVVTPERFGAAVVFLGSSGRVAEVMSEQGIERVPLEALGPLWNGRYHLLWYPPQGFSQPLSLGDDSPAVAQIASQFAALDGQSQPLTDGPFTTALQTRVRLFQRQHGLSADGVVGVQTLLRLNQLTGVDLTAEAARQILEAQALVQKER
ncbi:MAG: AAA family ATPase [Pseudomonadota bacterium]